MQRRAFGSMSARGKAKNVLRIFREQSDAGHLVPSEVTEQTVLSTNVLSKDLLIVIGAKALLRELDADRARSLYEETHNETDLLASRNLYKEASILWAYLLKGFSTWPAETSDDVTSDFRILAAEHAVYSAIRAAGFSDTYFMERLMELAANRVYPLSVTMGRTDIGDLNQRASLSVGRFLLLSAWMALDKLGPESELVAKKAVEGARIAFRNLREKIPARANVEDRSVVAERTLAMEEAASAVIDKMSVRG